jgi:hypothetical protein
MAKLVKISIGVVFFLGSFYGLALTQQDSLTVTTYYPSPQGTFVDLVVGAREAIGDVNADDALNSQDMAVDSAGNAIPGSLTVARGVGIVRRDLGVSYGANPSCWPVREALLDVNGYAAANNVWLKDQNRWLRRLPALTRNNCVETGWVSGRCGLSAPTVCPAGKYAVGIKVYAISWYPGWPVEYGGGWVDRFKLICCDIR